MSSANRSKNRPRLSVAMDVDPRENEEVPAEPTKTVDNASTTQETNPVASKRAPEKAEAKAPAEKPKRPASKTEAVQVTIEDPAIQEINGRVYVVVGDDLMPEGARVQMTVALTAIERHRWLQYAKQHDLTLIEVLRRAMSKLVE